MRKILKSLLIFFIAFCFTVAPACNTNDSTQSSLDSSSSSSNTISRYSPVNKVVLFIGDGMGYNHVYNAELYTNTKMYFSDFETQISVDTDSLSGLTDSAAAATAMATGTRTKNGYVGLSSEQTPLTSITELAKEHDLGAGVVTTDDITGATPGGFSAHTKSRSDSALIFLSQMENPFDFIMGSGAYANYKSLLTEKGFSYFHNLSKIEYDSGRFFAAFSQTVCVDGTDKTPTLTQMATLAVNYMERNYPDGYFLIIEGAKIDKRSHNGSYRNINEMIKELVDFSNTIKAVDDIIGGTYAFIVTADHETGGLQQAESVEQISNSLYTAKDHTDADVPLYFKSTLTETPEILQNDLILNTQIFDLCRYLLAI